MLRGSGRSKSPRQLDVLLVFASLVAPVVLAVLVSGQFTALEVKVDVDSRIDDTFGVYVATVLRVNVSNDGEREILPHFFIYWSGETSNVLAPWSSGADAVLLPAHSRRVYTIEAPDLNRAIPNGSLFFVRLYDEVTQEYAFSQVEKLILPHPPILANPDFQFWSSQAGSPPGPFGWSIGTTGGPGDLQNLSQSNSNNTKVRIAIYEDGLSEASGWTSLFLVQGLDARAVQSLRNSTLSLTVNPGFSYKANASSGYPLAFAGFEVNDGVNVVWIAFSCCTQGEVNLPHQQIFVFNAPVGQSSLVTLNFLNLLGTLSATKAWWFSIGVASSQSSPGWYVAEFGGLAIG